MPSSAETMDDTGKESIVCLFEDLQTERWHRLRRIPHQSCWFGISAGFGIKCSRMSFRELRSRRSQHIERDLPLCTDAEADWTDDPVRKLK
jgi:hypothetical protein